MLLPLIGEVIDKLKEVKHFNKLDLIWGYNNVQIKEGNEWKAVFLTNKGLFEPQVMYFGLCNLPGTFQQMMNSIFQELLHEGVLANYMDDFMILAKTMKELEERTVLSWSWLVSRNRPYSLPVHLHRAVLRIYCSSFVETFLASCIV